MHQMIDPNKHKPIPKSHRNGPTMSQLGIQYIRVFFLPQGQPPELQQADKNLIWHPQECHPL